MHPSKKAQRLEEIKKLRLFDDILMNQVFQNRTCAEFLLRTILNKESLVVTDVHTQESFNNLHGRGVRLDILRTTKAINTTSKFKGQTKVHRRFGQDTIARCLTPMHLKRGKL